MSDTTTLNNPLDTFADDTVWKSEVDTQSDDFQTNQKQMQMTLTMLEKQAARIHQGGPAIKHTRQQQQGKLFVRDRIALLLDANSPFLELSLFAGYQLYQDDIPAAGLITGIGWVHQTPCVIVANDPTVKGGTYYPITVKKHLRAQAIAEELSLPCLYLVDSGGAFLPKQDEVFPDRDHFGRIFYNQARLSAQGIPQIAVVMGSCTAGGAYVPAMADIAIMVKHQATIFLGGPPLVKAATGEVVTAEALGGADVHCRQSGVADYYADNDEHALSIARRAIQSCHWPKRPPPLLDDSQSPLYPIEDLLGIIPSNPRLPYDCREVIARLVDQSRFDEFKALFAQTLVCGFAQLYGNPIGIVANNGILFSDSALKGTHFIQLCEQRNIPLLFLQNINGFMVGQQSEANGIAKHGAKMVNAVACANVPKITVIIGGSYGAGNYAMCGRAFNPDFLFMWPNAKISVMGGEQAAQVLTQVKQDSYDRQDTLWPEKDRQMYRQIICAQYETQGSAFYASARLWDDGIISPLDTRIKIGLTLSFFSRKKATHRSPYGIFRM